VTHEQASHSETATETHHEPHGSASPHGAADDVAGHEPAGGDRVGEDAHAGDGHDIHDAHGEPLGPIDVRAWAAGAVGIVLGLVVVACMWAATGGLGAG
jgi:hypothetical protein